jgi:flagellar assembly protein FliH
LSKVLKGSDALQARAMVFAAMAAPGSQPRQPNSLPSDGTDGAREQGILLEKLHTLESAMVTAKREAFEAGHREGEQNARAALSPVFERMNASIVELVNMRPDLRRGAEKDAVELSLQIARRVLHRELSIDGNALNALARVVFDRLARTESWQLTIHPQFAEAIRGGLPAGTADKVRIDADPTCALGTVVVRSAEGVIDASVDSQLAEIGRGLMDRLTRQ